MVQWSFLHTCEPVVQVIGMAIMRILSKLWWLETTLNLEEKSDLYVITASEFYDYSHAAPYSATA